VSEEGKKNQGEGDREADRRYREGARQFVDEGHVGPAATAARRAVDGPEGASLRAAEQAGKSRIAEEDPEIAEGPLPSFWTDEQQSAWDRVKDALHRDWLQTKADFHLRGGAEIDQTAKDTMKQAAGKEPGPATAEGRIGWEHARHAIRLGHGAATFWTWEASFSDELEARVRAEWEALGTGISWEEARPLIRHGWEQGRKDVAVKPMLPQL
jgi:hypothetical protein